MKKTDTKNPTKAAIARRINALVCGLSVDLPNGLGTVKCVKSAKAAKDHHRRFSLTKSTVAKNGRNYSIGKLVEAFGLKG